MNEAIILNSALAWSGTLQRKLTAFPDFAQHLQKNSQTPLSIERLNQLARHFLADAPYSEINDIKRPLRLLRTEVFYTLMLRDIAGLASFEEVTQAMSHLADLSVQHAYETAYRKLAERHGAPLDPKTGQPLEMLILAMGKWGGKELNVSSDIDLICIYGPDGDTSGPRPLSHHEFFGKLTQQISAILSEVTPDGQVFRCDLRLRPDGDSGPLAWSMAAVANYLISQGREWERYAWIKARPLPLQAWSGSNPHQLRYQFEQLRTPFVYRNYFDFDALASLRELRERIRQDWNRRVLSRNGIDSLHNIKLGDGGIREIEFVVQLNQLIRGGRLPSLQCTNLLDAMRAQQRAGVLTAATVQELKQAYLFLRRTEHMLQYREDTQTHLLPVKAEDRQALATTMGLSVEDFETQLQQHRNAVSRYFSDAFRLAGLNDNSPTSAPITPEPEPEAAAPDDFQAHAHEKITHFLDSHKLRRLPRPSRARLEQLLPPLCQAAAQTTNPEETLSRLLNVMESIAQRSAYVALLSEYPETISRLTMLVSASPWAAQYLVQYPLVLDRLINWQSLMQDTDFSALQKQLHHELDACKLPDGQPDIEQQMNLMRDTLHQHTFELLAQDLSGCYTVEQLADKSSALADLMLEETLYRTWPLAQPKGTDLSSLPAPEFAIIAYGKLGGKELGYASDLDLVFLYDDPDQNASEHYVKLGRRMISWLSTLTSSGRLYEVDMRLRPDGNAGLIAVSVDSFEQYQQQQAWSWEHQALTRARFVAGSTRIGERFEQVRQDILVRPRDLQQLKTDIRQMRARIFEGHPNRSELFDLKHDSGGMVDIEFITQFIVLAHAHQYPVLLGNLGNITLLGLAAELGLIDSTLATQVSSIYRNYRKLQHTLRLQAQPWARVPPQNHEQDRQTVRALWEVVIEG